MRLLDKTSNPAFTGYFFDGGKTTSKKMTVTGIIIKSMLSILVIGSISIGMWELQSRGVKLKWYSMGGMLAAIVISIVISVRQHWAHILVPLYTIAKGIFLGSITAYAHLRFPNYPYQAVGITVVTFIVMLLLYQTRIIVVTKKLRSVIVTAAFSIIIVYLISFILSLFGIKSFIWGTSWVALVFNVIAAIVAAFTLLLDFDYIEKHEKNDVNDIGASGLPLKQ